MLYEQLLSSVPYTTLCPICNSMLNNSLYTEQSINYFVQKLMFFFKFNKFHPQKLFFRDFSHPNQITQLGLKFRHNCLLRAKVQFYKTVGAKSSLKFEVFSPDTEVIEQEQVIEMLDKPITLNKGQIMLSKVPESHNIV